jgi:hypothetical protein
MSEQPITNRITSRYAGQRPPDHLCLCVLSATIWQSRAARIRTNAASSPGLNS